ncbi:hypothetical protein [Actinomyces israelii]|uniref:hypothetical protein n=1 Tax=Actinomyces israelii TaxID=1659 RepID=UPI0006942636|nr:hypothetical protein [Actinomyces israelii]
MPDELTLGELELFLPRDSRALRVDLTSWTFWLLTATVARTLLSSSHVLFPRLLTVGIVAALIVQTTAWLVTRRYYPWASLKVVPFLAAGGLGYAVGMSVLDFLFGVRPLPRSAALVGAVIAITMQLVRRRRWMRRALKVHGTGAAS